MLDTGVVYRWRNGLGGTVRGDDGARLFLPVTECLGRLPKVGDRVIYDIAETDRGLVAVGARRVQAP